MLFLLKQVYLTQSVLPPMLFSFTYQWSFCLLQQTQFTVLLQLICQETNVKLFTFCSWSQLISLAPSLGTYCNALSRPKLPPPSLKLDDTSHMIPNFTNLMLILHLSTVLTIWGGAPKTNLKPTWNSSYGLPTYTMQQHRPSPPLNVGVAPQTIFM